MFSPIPACLQLRLRLQRAFRPFPLEPFRVVAAIIVGILAMAFSLAPGRLLAEEAQSAHVFPPVALANHLVCADSSRDRDLACAFLLLHGDKTYAVSAKHILAAMKLDGLDHVCLRPALREWRMFSKQDRSLSVKLGRLLNESTSEKLSSRAAKDNDWLVFEVLEVSPGLKALQSRSTPLATGEILYVVGWTNHQESGPQRVYEWRYTKTVGTRLLAAPVLIPEKIGGLSGAPVLDAEGRLVGLVSGRTVDPADGKEYFSPCSISGLVQFLDVFGRAIP